MRAGVRRLQAANAGGAGLGDQLAFPARALGAAALAALVVGGMLDVGLLGTHDAPTARTAGSTALSRASRLGLPGVGGRAGFAGAGRR
jgi:hypothetical protein